MAQEGRRSCELAGGLQAPDFVCLAVRLLHPGTDPFPSLGLQVPTGGPGGGRGLALSLVWPCRASLEGSGVHSGLGFSFTACVTHLVGCGCQLIWGCRPCSWEPSSMFRAGNLHAYPKCLGWGEV